MSKFYYSQRDDGAFRRLEFPPKNVPDYLKELPLPQFYQTENRLYFISDNMVRVEQITEYITAIDYKNVTDQVLENDLVAVKQGRQINLSTADQEVEYKEESDDEETDDEETDDEETDDEETDDEETEATSPYGGGYTKIKDRVVSVVYRSSHKKKAYEGKHVAHILSYEVINRGLALMLKESKNNAISVNGCKIISKIMNIDQNLRIKTVVGNVVIDRGLDKEIKDALDIYLVDRKKKVKLSHEAIERLTRICIFLKKNLFESYKWGKLDGSEKKILKALLKDFESLSKHKAVGHANFYKYKTR